MHKFFRPYFHAFLPPVFQDCPVNCRLQSEKLCATATKECFCLFRQDRVAPNQGGAGVRPCGKKVCRQSKEVIATADTEFSLLYYLADQAGCTRLSDLSALDGGARTRLALALEEIPADRTGLREWNAALTYLTGAPLRLTAEAAREDLISLLASETEGGDGK